MSALSPLSQQIWDMKYRLKDDEGLKDLTGDFWVGTLFLAGLCLVMAVLTRFLER